MPKLAFPFCAYRKRILLSIQNEEHREGFVDKERRCTANGYGISDMANKETDETRQP